MKLWYQTTHKTSMAIMDCEIKKLNFSNCFFFITTHKQKKTCRSIRFELESIVLLFKLSLVWSVVSCWKSRFEAWIQLVLGFVLHYNVWSLNASMWSWQMFKYVVFFQLFSLTTTIDTCASIRRASIQHFGPTRKKAIVKLLKPRNGMRNHRSSLSCIFFPFHKCTLGPSPIHFNNSNASSVSWS